MVGSHSRSAVLVEALAWHETPSTHTVRSWQLSTAVMFQCCPAPQGSLIGVAVGETLGAAVGGKVGLAVGEELVGIPVGEGAVGAVVWKHGLVLLAAWSYCHTIFAVRTHNICMYLN